MTSIRQRTPARPSTGSGFRDLALPFRTGAYGTITRGLKGIIFNLFEQVITHQHGEDVWDDVLDAAGLEGVYTSLGNYPDDQLIKLVRAAAAALKQTPEDVLRMLGARAIPLLASKYPMFFAGHFSSLTFLRTLNDVIHPEVRKLYPGADVPDFTYESNDGGGLRMTYASSRRLCAFAEGLITGAAAHYRERVEITQRECMHRGDKRCVFDISVASLQSA
jgi:hypothetical protein